MIRIKLGITDLFVVIFNNHSGYSPPGPPATPHQTNPRTGIPGTYPTYSKVPKSDGS